MLRPHKKVVTKLLARYRAHELAAVADPLDHAAWQCFQNTAYTLCVLMGERTALAAAHAAEHYLAQPRTGRLAASSAPS